MDLFDRCRACKGYGFYWGVVEHPNGERERKILKCDGYRDILKEEGITPAEEGERLRRFIYKVHGVPEDNAKLSDELTTAILIILGYDNKTIDSILGY
jgi:hypothetical protein